MANQDPGKIFGYDAAMVKARIEYCLKLYMTRQETESAMFLHERIPRFVTRKVWERLEKDNPGFFDAYCTRLMLKKQVSRFNENLQNSKPESTQLLESSNTMGGAMNVHQSTQIPFYSSTKSSVLPSVQSDSIILNTTFMPTHGFSGAVNLQGMKLPVTSSAVSGAEPHWEMVKKFMLTPGFSGETSSIITSPALNVQSTQSDVSSQESNSKILKTTMSAPELSGRKRKPGEDFIFPDESNLKILKTTMSGPEVSGKKRKPGEDFVFPDEPPNYVDSLDASEGFGDSPFLLSDTIIDYQSGFADISEWVNFLDKDDRLDKDGSSSTGFPKGG